MEEVILLEPYSKEMIATCVSVFEVGNDIRPLPLEFFEAHDCTEEEINLVSERCRQIALKIKKQK